jgi:hypothetical protein
MNNLIKIIIVLVILKNGVDSAKILAVYTTPSKSHLLFSQNLLKHLAEIGHQVCVIIELCEGL